MNRWLGAMNCWGGRGGCWRAGGAGAAAWAVAVVLAGVMLSGAVLAGPAYASRRTETASTASPEARQIEAALRSHIAVLASDEFGGREPGTEGETRTLRYIGKQLYDMGLVSGTNDPAHPWFAPVLLVSREPAVSTALFARHGRPLAVDGREVLMLTSARRALVERAPLLFVGRGDAVPARGELAGRVAVMFDVDVPPARRAAQAPVADTVRPGDSRSQVSTRQNALLAGGALAVLTVLDGNRSLESVEARRKRSGYALASTALGGDLEGFITRTGLEAVLAGGSHSLQLLEAEADQPGFAPHLLDITASLEASTRETAIRTFNVVGRLPGRRPEAGAVLLLAHWDHFGPCAQPPAEHLICNGAVDNASGVAALLEITRRLAQSRAPLDRDIYVLFTSAEELGLLGAQAFAESPPLPLRSVVAAFNLDSVAIAPAGSPLGMVGRGLVGLDGAVTQVAREQKRVLSASTAPNQYIRRQDGWALMQHDVPAVMVTSAYGDLTRLERFFDTDYHRPQDVMKPDIELGGAAEDVLFHDALVRYFADSRRYAPAKP